MEYASRNIFLGVAGKKARQGARVSGYDGALSVVCELLSHYNNDPLQEKTLCAPVQAGSGFVRGFYLTRPLTHSILTLMSSSYMSVSDHGVESTNQ
jgi:hypothetical protein